MDNESNPIFTTLHKNSSSFVSLSPDKNKLFFLPNQGRHIGKSSTYVILNDTDKYGIYKIDIIVFNKAPYFKTGNPKTEKIRLGSSYNFQLPEIVDDEFNNVNII
jgi:hypothetical protein